MTSKINLKTLFTMPMAPPPNKLSLHAKQFDGKTKERQCCARFYGGYCSLWPNRTARSLSRAWPSLLRAHNHIGGATAVPLHHKKCLLCSVLIYIVLAPASSRRQSLTIIQSQASIHGLISALYLPRYVIWGRSRLQQIVMVEMNAPCCSNGPTSHRISSRISGIMRRYLG